MLVTISVILHFIVYLLEISYTPHWQLTLSESCCTSLDLFSYSHSFQFISINEFVEMSKLALEIGQLSQR